MDVTISEREIIQGEQDLIVVLKHIFVNECLLLLIKAMFNVHHGDAADPSPLSITVNECRRNARLSLTWVSVVDAVSAFPK